MNFLLTRRHKLVACNWLTDRFYLDSTMFDLYDNNGAFRWALELTIVPSSSHLHSCLDLLFLHSVPNLVLIGLLSLQLLHSLSFF